MSIMAGSTLTIEGLDAILENLGVQTNLPDIIDVAAPLHNPVDIYRLYLSVIVSELLGLDKRTAHNAFLRTPALAKGDLTLVAPRLRLRSRKHNDKVSMEVAAKVRVS